MPSLKSNKNKWHIPPLPVPEGRCGICVRVPDNPEWIALFLGAIYRLSQQIWYDRDDAHSAKVVADAWREVYLETVESPLGNCGNGCLCIVRRDPRTGFLEYTDDGITFFRVPDGPWVDNPVEYYPEPKPRETGTDEQKRCNASYAAALVLQALYRETWDTFVNGAVLGIVWMCAKLLEFFESVLDGVLPFDEALEHAIALFVESDQFVEGGYPDSLIEQSQNILYCNSSVDTSGKVTFDLDAIQDEWGDLYLSEGQPWGGLNALFTLWLNNDSLNAAGNVNAGEGDCGAAPCDAEWCYDFNFGTDGQQGWSLINAQTGLWQGGSTGYWERYWTGTVSNIRIRKLFSGTAHITRVIVYGSAVGSLNQATLADYDNAVTLVTLPSPSGAPYTIDEEIDIDPTDGITLNLVRTGSNVYHNLTRITFYGTGANPFGTDNCV